VRKATVGDIVIYRPAIDDQRFHDKGHREILPAVVTKVWDGVENLQVLASLDLNVLQDAQVPTTFVPFVKQGEGIGTWSFKA
jgi:hypothetical protein